MHRAQLMQSQRLLGVPLVTGSILCSKVTEHAHSLGMFTFEGPEREGVARDHVMPTEFGSLGC
jgi:hypothetical protein